jgi:putative transcriptional regulator
MSKPTDHHNRYDHNDLLWDYACGSLSQASYLLVENYVALCKDAARTLSRFESIGGALIEGHCAPVAMNKQSLDAVLAAMNSTQMSSELAHNKKEPKNLAFLNDHKFPEPLFHHIKQSEESLKWKRFTRGMSYCPLAFEDDKQTATLLRVAPGMKTPHHSHHGLEMTLVLQGAFEDETGLYRAGDLMIADDDLHHQPVATKDEVCLCLVVSDAPAQFTGRFMGLLNFLNH